MRWGPFGWLWCSSVASAVAAGLHITATAWLALEAGGGGFAVGLVLAARMLPNLLFGLPAGTLADRVTRSRLLVIVSLAVAPVAFSLAWLAATDHVQLWNLIVLSFAMGCVPVFDAPARQALAMDTVPRPWAPNALAFNALGIRLATAVGAFGAGLLIPVFGVASCYALVAGSYAIAGGLALLVQPHYATELVHADASFGQAFREATRLVVALPAIRTLLGASVACEVLAFSYLTAVPVLARDVLGAGVEGLGALNAAASVGGTLAAVLLSVLPGRVPREPVLGGVFLAYGAALVALASAPGLALAAAASLAIGACASAFDVLQQTIVQLVVPEQQRGRAMGLWVLSIGSAPIGHLEMGSLVAVLGAPGALAANGSLVVLAASLVLAQAPQYRWTRPAAVSSEVHGHRRTQE
jgi:MFS family permease